MRKTVVEGGRRRRTWIPAGGVRRPALHLVPASVAGVAVHDEPLELNGAAGGDHVEHDDVPETVNPVSHVG